ncbi:MAG: CPBP family intramembrane metalloprotease [Anaerolineaceae bacterium]|nr:CPBP family intramembrane metalloprotease [Anaerolineaceae bacterium]
MDNQLDGTLTWKSKLLLFAACLGAGMMVYFFGGYFSGWPRETRLIFRVFNCAFFILLSDILRRGEKTAPYWRVAYAFFCASTAFLIAFLFTGRILRLLGVDSATVFGLAIEKLVDMVLICAALIGLSRLVGEGWGELYLQPGRWKLSLGVGLGAFAVFAALLFLQARAVDLSASSLLSLLPWLLIFVLANGVMEELHFRGIILRKLNPALGNFLANLVVTLYFTLIHAPVQYTPDIYVFIGGLFFLSLAWGGLMQKSGSLWGSALFHAGADLVIMLGVIELYTT